MRLDNRSSMSISLIYDLSPRVWLKHKIQITDLPTFHHWLSIWTCHQFEHDIRGIRVNVITLKLPSLLAMAIDQPPVISISVNNAVNICRPSWLSKAVGQPLLSRTSLRVQLKIVSSSWENVKFYTCFCQTEPATKFKVYSFIYAIICKVSCINEMQSKIF